MLSKANWVVCRYDHLLVRSSSHLRLFQMKRGNEVNNFNIMNLLGESRRGKQQLLQPGLVNSRFLKFIDAIWTTTYCTFVRNRTNGTIYAFGLNNYNQMGITTKDSETVFVPKKVPFENVKQITGKLEN